jgi:hypothetical protein
MPYRQLVRGALALVAVLAAVAAMAATANATTVVVPTDDELFAASRAVVEGRVAEIRSRRTKGGREIYTYVALDVTKVFAGDAATGRLVLKQMGGTVGDEFSTVYGSPEYTVGERVLVFLNTDDDGAWHTAFLYLGKYSVVSSDGRDYVVRGRVDDGVSAIAASDGTATERAPYDEFVAALARRAMASKRAEPIASAVAVPPELATPLGPANETYHRSFTLMSDHARWFEPDDGVVVPYKFKPTPVLIDGGMGAVADALAAWSNVPGCSLRLALVDRTDACGFVRDGVNSVSFDDCRGQIDGSSCFGIIAMGGASGYTNQHKTINGVDFIRITEADVVLNDGQETCLLGARLTLREVLTHELGHTIGLGHSSERAPEPDPRLAEATMYFELHDDGRGASIKPDDVDGVTFIYPASEVAPSVATESLAAANVGTPYAAQLDVSNGQAPFTWAATSGALPAGLTLSSDGAISGTPSAKGTATFSVTVTDARGRTASRDLSVDVAGPKPVVSSVVYKTGKKLTITVNLEGASDIEVWVDGARVSPPARAKARANGDGTARITVKGTAEQLDVTAPAGMNALIIVADGAASDPFAF